jgi:hypothetical protein
MAVEGPFKPSTNPRKPPIQSSLRQTHSKEQQYCTLLNVQGEQEFRDRVVHLCDIRLDA